MTARHSIILTFLLAFAFASGSLSSAFAQGDPRVEARTHYMNGKQRFDAGDFRGAIGEFSAADNLAPSAVNDFNIALAYERLDDPAQAVRYYRSYLDRMPSAPNRAEVEAALSRLDGAAKTAAAKADADRVADEARRAEEVRRAEEARRLAGGGGGGGAVGPVGPVGGGPAATSYPPTGDPDLDRVAAVDLAAMRNVSPLPGPTGGGGGGAAISNGGGGGGAASGGGVPPPGGTDPTVKKSKPFYKSPVFWVVAAVGLYVLIVLAQDDSSNQNLLMPLPDGPGAVPAGGGGATVLRF